MTSRYYTFTVFPKLSDDGVYYQDGLLDFSSYEKIIQYAIYSEESCPKSGRLHFQGYITFKHPVRLEQARSVLPSGTHVERMYAKEGQNFNYVTKKETHVDGPYVFGERTSQGYRGDIKAIFTLIKDKGYTDLQIADEYPHLWVQYGRQFKEYRSMIRDAPMDTPQIDLYPWQTEIEKIIQGNPTRRAIYWIWSVESGLGKSTFKDYICSKYDKHFLEGTPNLRDTLYAYDDHKIIWFDLPREQPLDSNILQQLEKLSDGGKFTSTKYESRPKRVNAHIVVTTNRPPPEHRLPKRIREFKLDNGVAGGPPDGGLEAFLRS